MSQRTEGLPKMGAENLPVFFTWGVQINSFTLLLFIVFRYQLVSPLG